MKKNASHEAKPVKENKFGNVSCSFLVNMDSTSAEADLRLHQTIRPRKTAIDLTPYDLGLLMELHLNFNDTGYNKEISSYNKTKKYHRF